MKRRGLLATTVTGLTTALAGCGYAYGGGDVRSKTALDESGLTPLGDQEFELKSDRIAVLDSGQQFVDTGETPTFTDVAHVVVSDMDGETLWEFSHQTGADSLAVGDRAYLYDEDDQVVASEVPTDTEDDTSTEVATAWDITIEGDEPQLEAGHGNVYVESEDRLLALRDASVLWEQSFPENIEKLHVNGDVVAASTKSQIVAFDQEGETRWKREGDPDLSVTFVADRLVFDPFDFDDAIEFLVLETGETRWRADHPGEVTEAAKAGGNVALSGRHGGTYVYDDESGELQWKSEEIGDTDALVVGSDTVYAAENCRTVAFDADGIRWERELESRDCFALGGWLDGDTVAYLFESGEIFWVQRTDQDPGLLW